MTETQKPQKPPLTPLRWFFAITGGLIMLFAGGCGLLYAGVGVFSAINSEPLGAMFVTLGLLYGGVPALIGALVWWAAVKWRRMPEP